MCNRMFLLSVKKYNIVEMWVFLDVNEAILHLTFSEQGLLRINARVSQILNTATQK